MISKKAYTYAEFEFSETVRNYLKMIADTYNESMEEEVIHQIYRMVRKDILNKDVNIIIKKIDIAIFKCPKRKKHNVENINV